jgi:hypothetical protein
VPQVPSDPENQDGPVNPEVFQTLYTSSGQEPPTWEEFQERIRLAKEAFANEKEDRLKREADAKANLESES